MHAPFLQFSMRKGRLDCSSNEERLDGHNGLLLTPTIDHLFDRGSISFEKDGKLLVSPVVHWKSVQRMGIADGTTNVGRFLLTSVLESL